MSEITITLSSPITEKQWDMITDVDFDCTDKIMFYTKHGKKVLFIKQKKAEPVISGETDEVNDEQI